MAIPYTTKEILLPINIVVMKLDSFLENKEIIFDDIFSLPLSSSNWSLFEETKAISIPEKNADNKIVIRAMVKSTIIFL